MSRPLKKDSKPKTANLPPLTLVGRCFHTFDENGKFKYQGTVRGEIAEAGYYLVQYFDWMAGDPNTMAVIHLSTMIDEQWQFYEDHEHMNFWYEQHGHRSKAS